ncbi:sensor domain-containing diguanylate cyclase [Clostridium cuniculi]|uniref:sensor domain-containing diguanylate cyclase n=1 Tax=Clostridium cuniculi TaxID=2548455 RepID=UPI00140FA336|nr:sensor domain-containing diguanylate cyclase [Clostridium cuniculi]
MRRVGILYKVKLLDIIIIFMTFLCFIGTLTLNVVHFYNSKQTQLKLKENDLQQYANECKNFIDQYFEYNFNILEYLRTYPEIYNMDWDQQYIFLRDDKRYFNFERFMIVDSQGKVYYANDDKNEIKDQSKEEFFGDVINNERFLTEPFIQVNENLAITTLSVSIYKDNEKVGALCGVLDLAKIYKMFENKKVGANGYSFLINEDGDYIAHKNNQYIFKYNNFFEQLNEEENNINFLKERIKNNNGKLMNIVLDNKKYYLISTELDCKNWSLIFVIPESEFLLELNNLVVFESLTILFGILFIILGMRLLFKTLENHKLAYTDSLTNISNRAAIDIMFKKLENNYKVRVVIVCFDLNDFKYVNDNYGHHIGDELLCIFSDIIDKTFGKVGFIGRMGGDEFIAILTNKNIRELQIKFKEVQQLISNYNNNNIYKINISYGYEVRECGDTISLLNIYKNADKKMYDFKKRCKEVRTS